MSYQPTQFSVVIPAYQAAATIARALHSVAAQTHPSFEVIVIDDGSTDNTFETVAGFSGVTVLRQSNSGAAQARNRGIESSQGEWIAFLDADDIWLPNHLEALDRAIKSFPSVSFVGSRGPRRVRDVDKSRGSQGRRGARRSQVRKTDYFKVARNHVFRRAVDMSSVAVRRETIETNFVYFENRVIGEDIAFFCQVASMSELAWVRHATTVKTRTAGSIIDSVTYSSSETDCEWFMREPHWLLAHKVAHDATLKPKLRRSARLYRDDLIARMWPAVIIHGHQECAGKAAAIMQNNYTINAVMFRTAAAMPDWLQRALATPLRLTLMTLGLSTSSPFQVRSVGQQSE